MSDYGTRGGSERGSIETRRLRQGLGGMYDWDPFRGLFHGGAQQLFGLEVNRKEDGYEIEMPVPGFRPEDLEINYQDGVITIAARNERRSFTRSLTVPDDIDEDNIQAHVEHGMLLLELKEHPQRQAKRITVGTGRSGMQQVGTQSAGGQTTTGSTQSTQSQQSGQPGR
jgi:HSP20 family protein